MFEAASTRATPAQWQAIGVFMMASLSACALITIGYSQAAQFGVLTPNPGVLSKALLVTAVVAIPMGYFAAHHCLEVAVLKDQLVEFDPVDELTGLIDRHLFERILRDELARMDRTGRPSAIAVMEIDHFERLTDRYGEGFTNTALKLVAAGVYSKLRSPFDKVCRWEGPVFIILLNDVSIGQAEQICDRLREASAEDDLHFKGQSTYVTLSFGVAPLAPGADIAHAFDRAQIGLEKAQRYGGNKVSYGGAWVQPD